jgi:hypothetical protein
MSSPPAESEMKPVVVVLAEAMRFQTLRCAWLWSNRYASIEAYRSELEICADTTDIFIFWQENWRQQRIGGKWSEVGNAIFGLSEGWAWRKLFLVRNDDVNGP